MPHRLVRRPRLAVVLSAASLLLLTATSLMTTRSADAQTARADQSETDDFTDRCLREVDELHRFFQEWSTGDLPDTDEAYARFSGVLADDFVLVDTEGQVLGRSEILDAMRGAHHRWPRGGRIWIEDAAVRHVEGGLAVLTYVEHQEIGGPDGRRTTRQSTVVFRPQDGTPAGVAWVHVHETWVAAERAAD